MMTTMRWLLIGAALMFALGLIWLRPTPALTGSTRAQTFSMPKTYATSGLCDETLWAHVYAGDPRKFAKPQDRLQIIQNCATVTGVIESAVAEKDGDWHVRIRLDRPYAQMLNPKNVTAQHGDLVLEPVCSNPVSQQDTLQENVCSNFSQHIFTKDLIGKRVEATGAYVLDLEHGWRELHPVSNITPLN